MFWRIVQFCPTNHPKVSLLHTSDKMLSQAESYQHITANFVEQISPISSTSLLKNLQIKDKRKSLETILKETNKFVSSCTQKMTKI